MFFKKNWRIIPIILYAIAVLWISSYSSENSFALGRTNDISRGKVITPRKYKFSKAKLIRKKNKDITIDLYAGKFSQGNAMYVEIYPGNNTKGDIKIIRAVYNNRRLYLSKRKWGYRSITAIHPNAKPGMKKVQVSYWLNGKKGTFNCNIKISKENFKFYPRPLDLGKYSDVDYRLKPHEIALIKRCTARKRKAFSSLNPDMLGESRAHPRNYHYITSPFWAKRLIMRYRKKGRKKIRFKNKVNKHKGLDFRGKTGEPVYAMADGKIVLAEKMYYEGNFIVVDHGNRVFSYFMHLHKISVKEGDIVKAGDKVGTVGSTGLSTASHLHVSLQIQGVHVNPLSILPLPVRN